MSDFHVSVPELNAFVSRMKGANAIITDELKKAGQRAGLQVEHKAKGYAPVWRGDLRRSITTKTTTTSLYSTTQIGTAKPYAKAIEFGRPEDAKWPPPGALLPWMAAKGIAAVPQNIKGLRKVRDDKGNIIGPIVRSDLEGPRRGYLPGEYLIARAVAKKIKKRPYLTKAFHELQGEIRREFHAVPGRVIARLKGGG